MITWLNYESYLSAHPQSTLSAAEFQSLADEAALKILAATHWRANLADDPDSLALLQTCQDQLVLLLEQQVNDPATQNARAGVSSASNHGYSESYASAKDIAAELHRRMHNIIHLVLGGPETKWMLYTGGVYHPIGRNPM